MLRVVISDTSTLILLHKIEQLDLLQKVYGEIITTPEIANEFGETLPSWIIVQEAKEKKYQVFLETQIDKGEASAIALATEFDNVLLLLDDLKVRKLASQLHLEFTGVLGVIHKAKQLAVIEKIKPLIEQLLQTNFRISSAVVAEILKLNNE